MGKYDYLIKRGWSKEEAKEYVDSMEEGMSPTDAYERVLGKGEKKAIVKREPLEIEVRPIKPSKPSVVKNIIKETKELGGTVVRGAKEYVPSKIRNIREDLETKRAYREAYRKHGYEAASSRGVEAELRHHKEMVGREAKKIRLAEEREKIALAAEKAARVERAKILTKQRYSPQGKRPQITRPEMSGLRSKQPYNMFTFEAARQFDPMGIYSFNAPTPRQAPNETKNQPDSLRIFELRGTPESANLWLSLVGYSRSSSQQESTDRKKRQKRRVQNIFSGMWEWVE